ncbi:MAG: tRNA (adenosine(37)-N6)-threonylcarbamoyltransferase complex ATPase subunit type 1 TsaE [Candidatus Omnitrophica bacterium]|nr:tRNA (adenosine(37)-N6)-threonylcarbamoyltransferase complex ATPase subunit type 1 TsaE [Candidatus Omnitrophota bacterium]
MHKEITSKSPGNTLNIGAKLAKNLRKGDIICLLGQLGSGKTVLTKGIAQGLGIAPGKIVSPSFVLMRQYNRSRLPLYHFDLYRLKLAKDIASLGYEEYFYDEGVSVVEWADRLGCLLPKEYLRIELAIKSDSQRVFKLQAFGSRYKELLERI